MRKYNSNLSDLASELVTKRVTMVDMAVINSVDIIKTHIYSNNIEGDIAEIGVWRGGMSIYMAYAFPDRKIWVYDSFEGFQPLNEGLYYYKGYDPHVEGFIMGGNEGPIATPLEVVKNYFKQYGLSDSDNIEYVKGFVRNTLSVNECKINKLALLRIDVDAYSATLETLEGLYDKVSKGGYIIFDDSGLQTCKDAIAEFERKRNIKFNLIYPTTAHNHGAWCVKPSN